MEIRVPRTVQGTQSGYFDDLYSLEKAAMGLDGQVPAIYFTPNPVDPDLLGRAHNRLRQYAKQGDCTRDEDIVRRTKMLVDFDPVRPSGISSTDQEHESAIQRAYQCRELLRGLGFPDPLLADSGNGAHLVFELDLLNDEDSKLLLKACLEALGSLLDDERVVVDRTTYNASRIWKLYGTQVRKGDELPDRPHRMATTIEVPDTLARVPLEALQRLAGQAPSSAPPAPSPTAEGRGGPGPSGHDGGSPLGSGDYTTLDVVGWFQAHDHYGRSLGADKHSVLGPWDNEHSDQRPAEDSDTVVWEAEGGQGPKYHCSHDHCVKRKLKDVLLLWGDADSYCAAEFQPKDVWQSPLPFNESAGPPFPIDALPNVAGDYALAEAEAIQIPVDLTANILLSTVAAASAGRAVVCINSEWQEQLNEYYVCALRSGERKSPPFRRLTIPLEEREKELVESTCPEIEESSVERDILEKRLQEAKTKAAKASSQEERTKLKEEALSINQELSTKKAKAAPKLMADDATSEAVTSLLAEQEGRIAVMGTEEGLFETLAGRYSQGTPNFDVYLKAYSGDPIRVDRMGRPSEFIPHPKLTMCLTVQPDVVRDLGLKRVFRGRGLLARIKFSMPQSMVGNRSSAAPTVKPELTEAWHRTLKAILQLPDAREGEEHYLTLSAQAQDVLRNYRDEIEQKLGPGGEMAYIADWGNKLVGSALRCAGHLHMIIYSQAEPRPWEVPISEDTLNAALRIGEYFEAHAHVAFGVMREDERMEEVRGVWNVLKKHGWK